MYIYHAAITNSNLWRILISSKSDSPMGALVTEDVTTISAMVLKFGERDSKVR